MNTIDYKKIKEQIEKVTSSYEVALFLGLKHKTGSSFYCPFHEDSSPSFIARDDYLTAKCSSKCGTFDIFELVEKIRNVNFIESVKILAEFKGIEIKESNIIQDIANSLIPLTQESKEYLKKRGLDPSFCEKYFGFKQQNEFIVLPQFLDGNIVAYKFMSIKDKHKKFIKGLNKSSKLYPNNDFKKETDILIFTAGEYDCIYLQQKLLEHKQKENLSTVFKVVTSSTGEGSFPVDIEKQLSKLSLKSIYIVYDHDLAGQTGALKLADKIADIAPVFILKFPREKPKGYDITDFFNEGFDISNLFELEKEEYKKITELPFTTKENVISKTEMTILNFIILNNEFISDVSQSLRLRDFSDYLSQKVFGSILNFYEKYKYVDFDLLTNKLQDLLIQEALINIATSPVLGSFEELQELIEEVQLHSYKKEVERSMRKVEGLLKKPFTRKELQSEITKTYENLLIEACYNEKGKTLDVMLDDFSEDFLNPDICRYLSTPFIQLNNALQDGLRIGKVTLIGALPSLGKTTLSIEMLEYFSLTYPVAYYALETDYDEACEQILSRRTQLNNYYFRKRILPSKFKPEEIIAENKKETDKNFIFVEAYDMTWDEIKNDIKIKKRKYNLKAVCVDLVQALRTPKGYPSRREFLADVTADMVTLAKSEDISLIGISHLKIKESVLNGKPKLEDLAETGELPRRAFTVILIDSEDKQSIDVDFILRKNRNGDADITIPTKFLRHVSTFKDND